MPVATACSTHSPSNSIVISFGVFLNSVIGAIVCLTSLITPKSRPSCLPFFAR
jgi:hypothetical protein